jgi:hypothetical protein
MLVVADQLDHLRPEGKNRCPPHPARPTLIDHDEKSGFVPAADVAPFIQ